MKISHFIGFLLLLGYFFYSHTVYAVVEQEETEVGITFGEFVKPSKPEPPIYKPALPNYGNKEQYLPSLGQFISSFILLLIGVACLLVFLGIVSLRKIYKIKI